MATTFINSADINQSIIPETTYRQTPTTGATRYELPVKVDSAPLAYKTNDIKSDTKRPLRAGNGKKQGMGMATGSWEFRLSNTAVFHPLLESALSGKFASGVLKAGSTDSTFSHIANLGTGLVETTPGCICNSVTIAGKMDAPVTATFAITGADRLTSTTDNALTVTPVGPTNEYVGADVASLTINGVALTYTEFTVAISHAKTARGALGTRAVVGYGVAGAREVTVTLKAYKSDFSLEALAAAGVPVDCEITIGGTGDGYKLSIPLADTDYPQDSVEAGSLVETIVLTARYCDAQTTDVIITQL